MTPSAVRPRGRPRSEEAGRAILEATLRLLGELGYARMSIEAIAAEAGVGKATIYRRYRGKADLASAAVAQLTDPGAPPDTGDTLADVREILRVVHRQFTQGPWGSVTAGMAMLGTLMVEEQRNPGLLDLFRERVILPRRRMLRAVLERGLVRGDVRAGADLDASVDALVGGFFSRYLSGQPLTHEWIDSLLGAVWRGLATR